MEENENNKHQGTPPRNRLSKSERAAIQAIYDQYAKGLFMYINYHVKDDADVVNELLQVTLERICLKVDQIPEGTQARAWMAAFAKRVIWEHFRRKQQLSNRYLDPIQNGTEAGDGEDPMLAIPAQEEADEELLAAEMQELIYRYLHLLTEREQVIFLHVFEEDMTPAEISKMYAVSVQTVKNQLSRARAKLLLSFRKHYTQ